MMTEPEHGVIHEPGYDLPLLDHVDHGLDGMGIPEQLKKSAADDVFAKTS
jgi:hypothetical protein